MGGVLVTRSFGPSLEDLWEEELKSCRKLGHDLQAMVSQGGAECLECRRCGTVFEESEVPTESAAQPGAGPQRQATPAVAAGSIRATVIPFNRIHRMQTRRAGVDEAMETHPSAGGVLADKCDWNCPECADRRTT